MLLDDWPYQGELNIQHLRHCHYLHDKHWLWLNVSGHLTDHWTVWWSNSGGQRALKNQLDL